MTEKDRVRRYLVVADHALHDQKLAARSAVASRRTLPVLPARAGHTRWLQVADLVGRGGRR